MAARGLVRRGAITLGAGLLMVHGSTDALAQTSASLELPVMRPIESVWPTLGESLQVNPSSQVGEALQVRETPPSIALATALSAVVPGAGQHYLGQKRAWAYLVLEAVGIYAWTDRRSAGADLRDRYRDFAWEEARIQGSARRDGDFDYYETMSNWQRSGSFDTDLTMTGIQPETEMGTFNASIWSLASRLFLGAPGAPDQAAMDRALEYYAERAYPTDQLWDWDASPGGKDRFGELITDSDDRFRQATNVLGAVIANHVVSAIDAFVSARGLGRDLDMQLVPFALPDGLRWHAGVRVGVR